MPGRKNKALAEKEQQPIRSRFFKPGRFPHGKINYSQVWKTALLCFFLLTLEKIKGVISVHKASDQTSTEVCDRRFKHFMDHWCWQVDHTGLKQMFSEKMNVWDLKHAGLLCQAIIACEALKSLLFFFFKLVPLKRRNWILDFFFFLNRNQIWPVFKVVKLLLWEMKAIRLECMTTICPLYKTVSVNQWVCVL